jgi:hypothetical protein
LKLPLREELASEAVPREQRCRVELKKGYVKLTPFGQVFMRACVHKA